MRWFVCTLLLLPKVALPCPTPPPPAGKDTSPARSHGYGLDDKGFSTPINAGSRVNTGYNNCEGEISPAATYYFYNAHHGDSGCPEDEVNCGGTFVVRWNGTDWEDPDGLDLTHSDVADILLSESTPGVYEEIHDSMPSVIYNDNEVPVMLATGGGGIYRFAPSASETIVNGWSKEFPLTGLRTNTCGTDPDYGTPSLYWDKGSNLASNADDRLFVFFVASINGPAGQHGEDLDGLGVNDIFYSEYIPTGAAAGNDDVVDYITFTGTNDMTLGEWTRPVHLPDPVNSGANEWHVFMGRVGDQLLFVRSGTKIGDVGSPEIWSAEVLQPLPDYADIAAELGADPCNDTADVAAIEALFDDVFAEPQQVAHPVNHEVHCSVSATANMNQLYFGGTMETTHGALDVWTVQASTVTGREQPATTPTTLGVAANSGGAIDPTWTVIEPAGDAEAITSVVELQDGTLCAAGWPGGRIWCAAAETTSFTLAWDLLADDAVTQKAKLFVTSAGTLLVGTEPDGRIYLCTPGSATCSEATMNGDASVTDLTSAVPAFAELAGTIYAVTNGNGHLWASTDDGVTWSDRGDIGDGLAPNTIVGLSQAYALGVQGSVLHVGVRQSDGHYTYDPTADSWAVGSLNDESGALPPHTCPGTADECPVFSGNTAVYSWFTDSNGTTWAGVWRHEEGDSPQVVYRLPSPSTWQLTSELPLGIPLDSEVLGFAETATGRIYAAVKANLDAGYPMNGWPLVYTDDAGDTWQQAGYFYGARAGTAVLLASDGRLFVGTAPYGLIFVYDPSGSGGDTEPDDDNDTVTDDEADEDAETDSKDTATGCTNCSQATAPLALIVGAMMSFGRRRKKRRA